MRRIIVAALAVIVLNTSMAAAQNPHIVGKVRSRDNGLTLTVIFKVAGLGNGDVTATVKAAGIGVVLCRNPGNGNVVPGQNHPPMLVSASQTIRAADVKNGTITFVITTPVPPTPTAEEAGCPNDNWTVDLVDVIFQNFCIEVVQGGQVVINQCFPVR